ncbi:hypothetical protein [Bifidobacterium choloepi]|uniref:Uncharacterized protein n=1 Tax=Bifidobacterium choloepi TaxID=2614131 RepID=A0A6I5N0K3_9BIFI|nr:hypothetical protein [Bifidobacterium choloepi]NEG70448.1 hypothetical protein [Bifidobacterium choloepi]
MADDELKDLDKQQVDNLEHIVKETEEKPGTADTKDVEGVDVREAAERARDNVVMGTDIEQAMSEGRIYGE